MTIWDSNTDIFPPNQFAAPVTHIQAFISGVIATQLPVHTQWIQAIASNPKACEDQKYCQQPFHFVE